MYVIFFVFRYKISFNQLRDLKTEIEHLQHLLERSKVQLLKDFEVWWAKQAARAQAQNGNVPTAGAFSSPSPTPSLALQPRRMSSLSSVSGQSSHVRKLTQTLCFSHCIFLNISLILLQQSSVLSQPSSQSRPLPAAKPPSNRQHNPQKLPQHSHIYSATKPASSKK